MAFFFFSESRGLSKCAKLAHQIRNTPRGKSTDQRSKHKAQSTGWGWAQGGSTQFPGVIVGPLPVRKCHQMLPKEHMQLGWVVRRVLSTPPRPPHGWAVRPCRASTSLAPLYSPSARLAFGWALSTKRIARGKFGRMCAYPKAIIHLVSHSRPRTYSHLPPAKRRAASDGRNSDTLACHVVGTCVIMHKRTCTVSEDQICRVSHIRSREGSSDRAAHVFDRGEYQVCITGAHFVCTGFRLGHVCANRPPLVF
jgi:hypothetical protein